MGHAEDSLTNVSQNSVQGKQPLWKKTNLGGITAARRREYKPMAQIRVTINLGRTFGTRRERKWNRIYGVKGPRKGR